MANTLSDLRSQIRLVIANATQWPDATLDGFIADAIRFYSAEWPRRWRNTLSLTTGTQAYALPGLHSFRGVVGVEYPAGEDPPEFLYQVTEDSPDFAAGATCYVLRGVADDTAIESDTSQGNIVFAETVTTGESAIIEYIAGHAIPTAGDDDAQITVPVGHWEALVAFVNFRAHMQKETEKTATVSTISIVLSQLGQEARLAWSVYKDVMDRLSWVDGESGQYADWSEVGGVGRVY